MATIVHRSRPYAVKTVLARNVKANDLMVTDLLYRIDRFPIVSDVVTAKRRDVPSGKWTSVYDTKGLIVAACSPGVRLIVLRPID